MPFSGASKNIRLIRPLLLTSRAALRDYCDEHGLIPREDATNSQMDALRNRIRLEILPTLRTINPNIDAGLAQVGEVTALDNAFIEAAMKDTFHDAVIFGDGNARIDRRVFQRLHLALARRFLRQVLARLGMDDDISYERISAAVAIGRDGNVGATALLPNAMRLRVTQNDITIEPIFQEL